MNYVASIPDYRWPRLWMSPVLWPLRLLLATIFHVFGFIGRLTSRSNTGRVLIIRTDGIGDAVLFEPALASLKQRFPECELHLWAPAATCDLMGLHPALARREIIPRGAKSGNLEYFRSIPWRAIMGWRLGHHRFDLAIYAVESPEPMGNWILRCVRAVEKWYCPGDLENQFEWQRKATIECATRLLQPLGRRHELTRNRHLTSQWQADASSSPWIYTLSSLATRQSAHWKSMAQRAEATSLVGIMAGSATSVNSYPIESWARAIRILWEQHRAIPVFLGGREDESRIRRIWNCLGGIPKARLPGQTNLRTIAALLPSLDAFISVDTGLAHMATAQNVPTVVLVNGGHPGRFFPWPGQTKTIVLSHRLPCEGCLCRCMLSEPHCVTEIPPDSIVEAYRTVVARASHPCWRDDAEKELLHHSAPESEAAYAGL